MVLACTETSSAEVGSSRMISEGSVASARATPTICFSPPLSMWGYLYMYSGGRSTISSRRMICSTRFLSGLVHPQRHLQDLLDVAPRVQRGPRVLEDDLDRLAQVQRALALAREQLLAAEPDAAGGRLVHADGRVGDGALAGARLAHQAQGLSLVQGEGDAVDRLDGDRLALWPCRCGRRRSTSSDRWQSGCRWLISAFWRPCPGRDRESRLPRDRRRSR